MNGIGVGLGACLVMACGASGPGAAPSDGPGDAAWVSFGGLETDSTIAVTYRVEVSSGRLLRGRARARLHPRSMFCG